MKNAIFILIECDNENIIYHEIIPMIKKCCKEYFGSKHFWEGAPHDPICYTNEYISQDDIKNILASIDNTSIRLYGLNNFVGNTLKIDNIITFPGEVN